MRRAPFPISRLLTALAAAALVAGCRDDPPSPTPLADADAALPWDAGEPDPEPRPGMVWIPPGVLIAGTPPDRLPRVADEEMAGEQVVMRGFYIDVFPYPNEAGAIPTTNLTQADGLAICERQGKRLCTELEWERACKGPANTTYEYGDAYKPSICGTGSGRNLVPNGVNAGCQSAFGVHDLHGGVWSWTSSQWGRDSASARGSRSGASPGSAGPGAKAALVTVRGGNGTAGELIGRCANGRAMKPEARREDVGLRCCAGEVNSFEVVLSVTRGNSLVWQPPDARIAPQLEKLLPDEVQEAVRGRRPEDQFKVERMWIWRPLGNEELVIGGGCAHPPRHARCGLIIARMRFDTANLLAFVSTDWWQPTLSETDTARELYVYGGDIGGAFRKKVSYEWGRIGARDKERKKKRKGKREPTYD